MGYLISLSILRGTPKCAGLHQLPKSLPWKLYRARALDLLLLDVFNVRRDGEQPFATIPAVQDLALKFEPPLTEFNDLYEALLKKNRANGFKRAFVNLNLMVSRLVEADVLSLLSDDEGIDLAALASKGKLKRLRFRAGGIEVQWAEGDGVSESKGRSSVLHRIARTESTALLGAELPIFGFDGDASQLDLELIDRSPPLPPPPPKPPRGGWAAYEERLRQQQPELQQIVKTERKKWWWPF